MAGPAAFSDDGAMRSTPLGEAGSARRLLSPTPVEQQLGEEATERVPDDDGRRIERLDDLGVVVDDLGDTEPGQLARVFALLSTPSCLRGHSGASTSYPALVK